MAKITVKASAAAVEEAASGGDFKECPEGYFVMELQSVEKRTTKDGKSEYLNIAWKPVGVGRQNGQLPEPYSWVWDTVMLEGESTEWKRAEFLLCVGKPPTGKQAQMSIEVEKGKPGTVIGAKALVKVFHEEYQGNPSAKVKKAWPWSEDDDDAEGDADATDATDDTEGDGTPDTALDEAFGDDDGTTTDDGEDYVPWTKETLMAEDNASIKEIIASFAELGHKVTVKKGSTKGQVIDLVLEVQEAWMAEQAGASDDGDTAPEDEPF